MLIYDDIDKIVGISLDTVNIMAQHKEGPDALLIYFRYIQQRRMQENSNTHTTDSFMMNYTGRGKERFYKAKRFLQDRGLIEQIVRKGEKNEIIGHYVKVNYVINIENPVNTSTVLVSQSQAEPESGKQETNTLVTNTNTLITKEKVVYSASENEKDNSNAQLNDVLEFWNKQNIKVHGKLNKDMEKHIVNRLKDYDIEELKIAIQNYSDVLADEKSYFKHKWTLGEFMQRENGMRVFLYKRPEDYYSAFDKKNVAGDVENLQHYSEEFETFWNLYPHYNPSNKDSAFVEFQKHDVEEVMEETRIILAQIKYGLQDTKFVQGALKMLQSFATNEEVRNKKMMDVIVAHTNLPEGDRIRKQNYEYLIELFGKSKMSAYSIYKRKNYVNPLSVI